MNREQARKNWEVIKAYGEGKELQYRRVGDTEWHDERKNLGFCFDVDDCEFRIKPEENYTGSVSEKHYRPFYDCNELIEHYQRKYKSAVGCDIYFPSLYKPCIWIRDKTEDAKGDIELITGFTGHGNVLINGTSYPLQHLFQMYEFLDGTPVGVEE